MLQNDLEPWRIEDEGGDQLSTKGFVDGISSGIRRISPLTSPNIFLALSAPPSKPCSFRRHHRPRIPKKSPSFFVLLSVPTAYTITSTSLRVSRNQGINVSIRHKKKLSKSASPPSISCKHFSCRALDDNAPHPAATTPQAI